MKKLAATIFFSLLAVIAMTQTQEPFFFWSFEGNGALKDQKKGKLLDTSKYHVLTMIDKGQCGNALFSKGSAGVLATDALSSFKNPASLTIEFLAKGKNFFFTSYPGPQFRLIMDYDYIQFITTHNVSGKAVNDNFLVQLRGSGITSYNYLNDGNWHHYVFRVDAKAGIKQIWIDGQTATVFTKQTGKFNFLVSEGGDGFRFFTALDEFAIYDSYLSDNLIRQHYQQTANGKNYTFTFDRSKATESIVNQKEILPFTSVDNMEFAPGYPNYTVQATDQLKAFPDPRYAIETTIPRNFPWLDITYLHRELPGTGGKGFGATNPQKAVELVQEMASRWNYYLELRCLRTDETTANKQYSNPSSLEGALIKYANDHPELPAASVIMQIQNNPTHAGYDQTRPFIISQQLPDNYYLRDKSGKVIISEQKKWISPLAPLDIIQKDANTTSFYLRQMAKYLTRPVNMINDNGEVFGHMRPESLMGQDPSVVALAKKLRLNNAQLNGWFQNRLDSCYKHQVLNSLGWKNTSFTFYNVSAVNSNYWPDYAMRRNTNSLFKGQHRSTPAFYPAFPWNWQLASGPYNGYGVMAEGRFKEIQLGDTKFAPFVAAGWGLEENNIRPAQWLGLLKSMVMLGADFFHVGYFNVTGTTGWPDGKGPNDPRGYAYQIAMPSYAQAIASRTEPFFSKGTLLNPATNDSPRGWEYRFSSLKQNHIIMVRKLGDKYLIFGAVQPNSNLKGNTPITETAKIILNKQSISFNIRRQGSMYILDLAKPTAPIWYQLDGWHQYDHPWYWSKDVMIEAENADKLNAVLFTNFANGKNDFRSFTTYARVNTGGSLSFSLPAAGAKNYRIELTMRGTGSSPAVVQVQTPDGTYSVNVNNKSWQPVPVRKNGKEVVTRTSNSSMQVICRVLSGIVEIDKAVFIPVQ